MKLKEKWLKIYKTNSWNIGDKVRVRHYENSKPYISKQYGFIDDIILNIAPHGDEIVVYWPLSKKKTSHDIDLVPA